VHDLAGDELGDGQADHVGACGHVGDDAPHLVAAQAVRDRAEPEDDLMAVDGVDVEVDRDPRASGAGEPVEQRLGGLA
jgi:hypothetical protein